MVALLILARGRVCRASWSRGGDPKMEYREEVVGQDMCKSPTGSDAWGLADRSREHRARRMTRSWCQSCRSRPVAMAGRVWDRLASGAAQLINRTQAAEDVTATGDAGSLTRLLPATGSPGSAETEPSKASEKSHAELARVSHAAN